MTNAKYRWHEEGYVDAMRFYKMTGERPVLKSFEPCWKDEYVKQYANGFNKALEEIDKETPGKNKAFVIDGDYRQTENQQQ